MRYLSSLFVFTSILLISYIIFQSRFFFTKSENIPFVKQDVISYLKSFQKGIVTSSVLTLESEQKVTQIDTKGGILVIPETTKPSKYKYKIQLTDVNMKQADIYLVEKPKNLTVLIPQGSSYKNGTFSDLHIGDTIWLQRIISYDISGKSITRILSTKITKLNK